MNEVLEILQKRWRQGNHVHQRSPEPATKAASREVSLPRFCAGESGDETHGDEHATRDIALCTAETDASAQP
jgi:hypothetical protein